MRRGIGFVPGDVVENFEAQSLQGEADAENVVVGARNPKRAVGFEQALALAQPAQIEGVNLLESLGFVPIAFVNGNHLPILAGDSARREKIGRIGKNQVESLAFSAMQQFERIALIQAQPAFGVVPERFGIMGRDNAFEFGREIGKRLEERDVKAQFGMVLGLRQDDLIVSGSRAADQVWGQTKAR